KAEAADGKSGDAAPAKAEKADAKPAKPAAKDAPKGAEDWSPAARRVATEKNIDPAQVEGTGRDGRVTKEDVVNFARDRAAASSAGGQPSTPGAGDRPEERVPMTRIRAR